MRKRLVKLVLAVGVIMALAIPVGAAELHGAHQGLQCKGSTIKTLHFVNNQTRGQHDVVLWLKFDDGTAISAGLPDTYSRNVNHWRVDVTVHVELTNAWTTINLTSDPGPDVDVGPGKLVLSDGKCKSGKSIFDG